MNLARSSLHEQRRGYAANLNRAVASDDRCMGARRNSQLEIYRRRTTRVARYPYRQQTVRGFDDRGRFNRFASVGDRGDRNVWLVPNFDDDGAAQIFNAQIAVRRQFEM